MRNKASCIFAYLKKAYNKVKQSELWNNLHVVGLSYENQPLLVDQLIYG